MRQTQLPANVRWCLEVSAIVTAKCCCNGGGPGEDSLYTATVCEDYEIICGCAESCGDGDCCGGPLIEPTLYLCGEYLQQIGFSPSSFSGSSCYLVKYRDCVYSINIISSTSCPQSPPYPQPFNVGSFYQIKPNSGSCCNNPAPYQPCENDVVNVNFPYSDPWGVVNPVKISSNLKSCVFLPGTNYSVFGEPSEWMSGGPREVSHNTYQEVGKCFETQTADNIPSGPCLCDRSAGGAVYFQKIGELRFSESWDSCSCIGFPGGCWYTKWVEKCYSVNECADSKCWGICDDPVALQDCIDFRNNNDICNCISDPIESYQLDTRYNIIKACKTYEIPQGACECDYYEADAVRLSFSLCYATGGGYDPTNPSQHAAIKAFYENLVDIQPCLGCSVGTPWGSQGATCISVCGYTMYVYSGGAGEIAANINNRFCGKVTAASLNQWFWFGTRQGGNACGGDVSLRPPHAPGDVLEFDRVELDIGTWRARVFLKGKSTRFRYCVSQVLSASVTSGRATCMSSNAVSPAEWAAGTRPSLVMVKTNSVNSTIRCKCPDPVPVQDCTSVGTYPQSSTVSGSPPVVTPGYGIDQLGSPCGNDWLQLDCSTWACCPTAGCPCGTEDCQPCCNCAFGASPVCDPPCIDHINQSSCGCTIPSNQQITILL